MTYDQELTQADRHIANAEDRILRQFQRIERMKTHRQDTIDAEALVRVMKLSLALLQDHRQRLADKLADEDRR
jgi:hypothetical protein